MISLNTPEGSLVRCIRSPDYPRGFIFEGDLYEIGCWDDDRHGNIRRQEFGVRCHAWTEGYNICFFFCKPEDFELVSLPEGAER